MSVIDANGNTAFVGEIVLFAQTRKGAQEFIRGAVAKVNEKTVTVQYFVGSHLDAVTRKSGCFVIVYD